MKRCERLVDQSGPVLAPWQAIPVCGPITQHLATALAIRDDDSVPDEERAAAIHTVIEKYKSRLEERTRHHLGYPYNLDFDYGPLEGLMRYSINNLGDPFIESNYGVHSREFEVGVLNWFAKLWEIDEEEYWGYITNCGTEGNLHGILVGRENFPDAPLYASAASHYSVFKAARMYRMEAIKVPTLETGEVDYGALEAALKANVGRPAVINVNVGTTVRGAVDDLDRVLAALEAAGYSEDRFYIHCDGALFGMMMPFLKRPSPMVTFRKPIGSVSVSGHKFLGAPVPCGVVITRLRLVMALSSDVEYLNSRDATIMGSRNGHAPVYLWYALSRKGRSGLVRDVERCMRNARTLREMLTGAGVVASLNELSNTVVFERPPDEGFVRKWQLACEGPIAHVVVMPNVTLDTMCTFVQELVACRARAAVAAARRVAAEAREAEAVITGALSEAAGASPDAVAEAARCMEAGRYAGQAAWAGARGSASWEVDLRGPEGAAVGDEQAGEGWSLPGVEEEEGRGVGDECS